jgi:hypothetical protein
MFLLLHEMMLRHQVSFVLKPTENGGFDLGIKWSLGLSELFSAVTWQPQFRSVHTKMFPCRMEGREAALGRRLHCIHDPRLHRPAAHQVSTNSESGSTFGAYLQAYLDSRNKEVLTKNIIISLFL